MIASTELLWIITIMNGIIFPIIALGVKGLFNIRRELSLLNGKLGKMETRLVGHEQLDEERHEGIKRDIDRIEREKPK